MLKFAVRARTEKGWQTVADGLGLFESIFVQIADRAARLPWCVVPSLNPASLSKPKLAPQTILNLTHGLNGTVFGAVMEHSQPAPA